MLQIKKESGLDGANVRIMWSNQLGLQVKAVKSHFPQYITIKKLENVYIIFIHLRKKWSPLNCLITSHSRTPKIFVLLLNIPASLLYIKLADSRPWRRRWPSGSVSPNKDTICFNFLLSKFFISNLFILSIYGKF